jgi:hypothetical protein
MQHTDYLSKTEENIYYIIDTLKCYTEHGFIASLYVRNVGDLQIQKRLTEVRQCLSIVHLEYLNLIECSLKFNELWATEDNNRYTTAERMFNLLRSSMESLKREFRKSCPISHAKLPDAEKKLSVFEKSVLARGGCARDLFGIESFRDNIQALFYEQRALFTNVLASLLVCRDVISKEKEIKADKKLCIELLMKQCDEIIADMKCSIKYTQAPVTCEIQKLIDSIGFDNAAQEGFHRFGLEDITDYALLRDANNRQAKVVKLEITQCYQNAEDMRIFIKCFNEFRPEPTRKKPTSLKVLFAVNWMGGTIDNPIQSYYDVLADNYEGTLPCWHTVSTRKNAISNLSEEQNRFNKELEAFIAEKKALKNGKNAI